MKLFLVAVFLVAAEAASLGEDPCTRGPAYWCSSIQAATSCEAFSHCLKNVWKPQGDLRVHKTKGCVYGQKAVRTVQHLLTKEKGMDDAVHLMASMCTGIRHDSRRREECKFLVHYFRPQLLDLMDSGTEPVTVAAMLGLCKPVKEGVQTKAPGNSTECQLCQMLVGGVDSLLTENKTEDAIRKALEEVCSKFPSGIAGQCLAFVDEYVSTVIQLLVQEELNPQQVCQELSFCSKALVPGVRSQPAAVKEKSSTGCLVCKLVVDEVIHLMSNNRSEDGVRRALDKVCSLFPVATSSECQNFVDAYTPTLVHLLLQELKAADICDKLKLCSKEEKDLLARLPVASVKDSGKFCTVCEIIIGILETQLAMNKSEEDIEKLLDDVCNLLPANIGATCKSIVDTYWPSLVILLEQELPPSEICLKIGLCNATRAVPVAVPKADPLQKQSVSSDPVKCDLCKLIITQINDLLRDNRSEEAIIEAVEKVCDLVQGDLRLQCQSEVQNYGPAVLDLLKHMDDPEQVCASLRLCSSTPSSSSSKSSKASAINSTLRREGQSMLGGEQCTWGPSFWCANVDNARKCGMEVECVERYGMKP